MPRIIVYWVVRALMLVVGALGFYLDYTGKTADNLSPSGYLWAGIIAFGMFFLITLWREIELYLFPRPKVEFQGLSLAMTEFVPTDIGSTGLRQGYFTRLVFKNNAKYPSGDGSTAHQLVATITVFDADKKKVDEWGGRWANTDPPTSHGEKWLVDRIDLPANNQEAILDIGLRLGGDSYFQGWENGWHLRLPPRKHIEPGKYKVQVILGASNFKAKTWQFSLENPIEPQSDECHIKMECIK